MPTFAKACIRSVHLGMVHETLISSYLFKDIFARFATMREEKILASVIEIQKENWG